MKNHYICTVTELTNNREVCSTYFDGTHDQAVTYFKSQKRVRKYLNRDDYEVFMRGNSINLNEV